MKTAEFTTSIGPVCIEAGGHDWFNVQSAPDRLPAPGCLYAWPDVHMTLSRSGDRWELRSKPLYWSATGVKDPAPPALVDELLKLGREWAAAHPDEFERASTNEFEDLLLYMTHDLFDQLAETIEETQQRFSEVLEEPEFTRQAPAGLRERVQDAVKLLHALRLQAAAAVEAISAAAEVRP